MKTIIIVQPVVVMPGVHGKVDEEFNSPGQIPVEVAELLVANGSAEYTDQPKSKSKAKAKPRKRNRSKPKASPAAEKAEAEAEAEAGGNGSIE